MSKSQPWYQRYPTDEFAETISLTCEEYGFLQRLRDLSWHHNGIPDSTDSFKRIGRAFQLSPYKLKKLWPQVENFFVKISGNFYYQEDENRRLRVVEISDKRKIAGAKGAHTRWSEEPDFVNTNTMANGIANAIPDAMANAMANGAEFATDERAKPGGEPEPELEPKSNPPPPPTPSASEVAAAAAPPSDRPQTHRNGRDRTHEHAVISRRAALLGMGLPSRELAERIRKKFSELPVEALVELLPKFQGQEGPGLWDSKSRDELEIETKRQAAASATPGDRKPAAGEQQALEMLDRDRERRAKPG